MTSKLVTLKVQNIFTIMAALYNTQFIHALYSILLVSIYIQVAGTLFYSTYTTTEYVRTIYSFMRCMYVCTYLTANCCRSGPADMRGAFSNTVSTLTVTIPLLSWCPTMEESRQGNKEGYDMHTYIVYVHMYQMRKYVRIYVYTMRLKYCMYKHGISIQWCSLDREWVSHIIKVSCVCVSV